MIQNTQSKLLEVLDRLREAGLHTTLRQDRENAVSIDVVVPGQRWEIDVLDDGSVELEVFRSEGVTGSEAQLTDLIAGQKGHDL